MRFRRPGDSGQHDKRQEAKANRTNKQSIKLPQRVLIVTASISCIEKVKMGRMAESSALKTN